MLNVSGLGIVLVSWYKLEVLMMRAEMCGLGPSVSYLHGYIINIIFYLDPPCFTSLLLISIILKLI